MWARICEILIGIWLIGSHWIFHDDQGIGAGILIIFFALCSYIEKLNKMHLLQVVPAGWLLTIAYTYPTPWLPFSLQNYILSALTLLMFALIPSNASDHPRPWKKFLAKKEHSKEE
jgi:hypothetical protein